MPVGSNSDAPVAATAARARACLDATIVDLFMSETTRLDDATRLALRARLTALVGSIEGELRRRATRWLAKQGQEALAAAMLAGEGAMIRLERAGVLRDRELMGELIAQGRSERIAERLPPASGAEAGLLVRLMHGDDRAVAAAARALMAAGGRLPSARTDLPAEAQHRLVWWVAAALRAPDGDAVCDRALVKAARRWLAAADEGETRLALAARLAAALDPLPDAVPPLLVAAIGDGRLDLFVALLARALAIDLATMRALILDPVDGALWWALRAVGLGRDDIARLALAFAEADPRRDIERIADRLDAIATAEPEAARAALAPLMLPADFRAAIDALAERPA